jgi:hypothetical protein
VLFTIVKDPQAQMPSCPLPEIVLFTIVSVGGAPPAQTEEIPVLVFAEMVLFLNMAMPSISTPLRFPDTTESIRFNVPELRIAP